MVEKERVDRESPEADKLPRVGYRCARKDQLNVEVYAAAINSQIGLVGIARKSCVLLACLLGFAGKGGSHVGIAKFPVHRCQIAVGDRHGCRRKKAVLDCLLHLRHTTFRQG